MRFKVVVCAFDAMKWLPDSLASIAEQTDSSFDVCVVDDHSNDARQPEFIERYCGDRGWISILNDQRRTALPNIVSAVHELQCEDDDVIVLVDGDDRLAHPDVLALVRARYGSSDVLLTYGSYICDPPDSWVTPARSFPTTVILDRAYRTFTRRHVWFNHLRTFRYGLFSRIDPAKSFKFPNGRWLEACYDTAIMVPCLELADGRFTYISDVLYVYTRNNPLSDCRVHEPEVSAANDFLLSQRPLSPM